MLALELSRAEDQSRHVVAAKHAVLPTTKAPLQIGKIARRTDPIEGIANFRPDRFHVSECQ